MLTCRLKIGNKTWKYPSVLFCEHDINTNRFSCMKISEDFTEMISNRPYLNVTYTTSSSHTGRDHKRLQIQPIYCKYDQHNFPTVHYIPSSGLATLIIHPYRFFWATSVYGQPFVKRFSLCYRTDVCPVLSFLSVGNVGVLWMDQDEAWRGSRPQSRPHCAGRRQLYPIKGHSSPNFRSMSVVAKRLNGLRCQLVWS